MNKYSIFLIARKPIFNPEKINMFEKLNKQYAIYLNSLLYFNWIEILSSLEKYFDFYLILHAKDKDFIPKNFIPESGKLILIETEGDEFVNDIYKNLQFVGYLRQIFIFYNSIGIRKEDISKTFDLLSIDDQAVVIGKSIDEKIAFFGTNTGDKIILNNLFSGNITYTKLLNKLSKEDIFIQTINKFSSINNFSDLKKLYIELSKKDSLSFCSENMHERFNDLFIEYKDLLNE